MSRKNDNEGNLQRKVAYLFSGQGSQWVGMGLDLYQDYRVARRVFDEADDVLGFPLSQICFYGPQEELEKTENAQPAILTVSVACMRVLEEKKAMGGNYKPEFIAGHSLGELTALVAAQSLAFHDVLRLVRRRGQLMQEAADSHPGTMVAVLGLESEEVSKIIHENGVKIANINSSEQIVISGARKYMDEAVGKVQARGGKTIYLEVCGAFHTPLMRPAQEGFKQYVSSLNFKDPVIPILSNTSARPLTRARSLKKELVKQLCHCVKWQQSMEYMLKDGITTAIEIGSGKVLSGILRRINPDIQIITLNSSLSLENIPPLQAPPPQIKPARVFVASGAAGQKIRLQRRRKELGWAPSL